MAGFGINIQSLLNRKYNILQQEADARTKEAEARVVGAQRPFVPDNGVGGGGPAAFDVPDPALAELEKQKLGAQIGAANAQAKRDSTAAAIEEGSYYDSKRAQNFGYNSGTPDDVQGRMVTAEKLGLTGAELYEYIRTGKLGGPGLKRGMTKVPGKGKKDNFPAMLAPGEAVLNANAAKKLGRGLIAHLNAYGNAKAAKKGMV